jgi:hypothetical protein
MLLTMVGIESKTLEPKGSSREEWAEGWVGGGRYVRYGRIGGRCVRYGWIGGRRERVRGEYRV